MKADLVRQVSCQALTDDEKYYFAFCTRAGTFTVDDHTYDHWRAAIYEGLYLTRNDLHRIRRAIEKALAMPRARDPQAHKKIQERERGDMKEITEEEWLDSLGTFAAYARVLRDTAPRSLAEETRKELDKTAIDLGHLHCFAEEDIRGTLEEF